VEIDFEKFHQEGFAGPFQLFDLTKAEDLLRERYIPAHNFTWYKSTHEKAPKVLETATEPKILSKLKEIFKSNNIILWASHFIHQAPGQSHGWHLDVEYGKWDGVTIWLGLKNLNEKTTVSLITRSHLLETFPVVLNKKFGINIYDDQAILKEAQKLDPKCELKTFTLKPGEFIIWSGRAWHTTLNKSNQTRHSIIFQYSTTENKPQIPLNYDYPDTKWSETQPPCILISGEDQYNHNKLLKISDIRAIKGLSYDLTLGINGFKWFLNDAKRESINFVKSKLGLRKA
jgi:ectoine hydroxylase-related dioxygenase (phytanoyl-CoA dioxygenase family)